MARVRGPSQIPKYVSALAGYAYTTQQPVVFLDDAPAAADAGDEEEIRISVTYPTEEEERWLDSWVDKYRESAYLNRIIDDGAGAGREGYHGRFEFVNDRPRLVVDKVHSGASSPPPPSSKPPKDDDDDLLLRNLQDDEL
ncbi:hypothetical protein BS78_08G008600 [Paspalum vaginatum]|nr:hypothetical protein BS78_08G008600 [Paspalum vaginatum]